MTDHAPAPDEPIVGAPAPAAVPASETVEVPGADPAPGVAGPDVVAVFKVVELVSVVFSLPSPSPILLLREDDEPWRELHFPIGLAEAQSIAMAIDHDVAPRPLTHELLVSVLAATNSDVVAVRLTGEREGTILGELDLMTPSGHVVLDCRPTDGLAVALRLRVPAPILCDERLLTG